MQRMQHLDIQTRERGTKQVFPVNLEEIHSAVPKIFEAQTKTSSSAATERLREPLSQLKSCQLLHNCTKNHVTRRIALSYGIKISPVGSLD